MNSVQLIGNLTKDPVMTKGGVAFFTLAVNRHDKDNNTDFPNVKVFGKQAENVCKFLKKGSACGVEGRLETGAYEKDGKTIYYTGVIANRVEFIGGGKKAAENGEKGGDEAVDDGAGNADATDDFEAIEEDVPF